MINTHSIKVIGHKNLDTDSICAAIAYSRLKNQVDPDNSYKPCRAGSLNRETEFVLRHFKVPEPQPYASVSPQIRDIDVRQVPGVDGEMSMHQAWTTMRDQQIDTLCIVDGDRLKGLLTVKDIATANMDRLDAHILAEAKTSYQNVVETLNAEVVVGNIEGRTVEGNIVIGASNPDIMEKAISKGDIVILGNRTEGQLTAIEMNAACIVVCLGIEVSRSIRLLAEENNCIILRTDYNA